MRSLGVPTQGRRDAVHSGARRQTRAGEADPRDIGIRRVSDSIPSDRRSFVPQRGAPQSRATARWCQREAVDVARAFTPNTILPGMSLAAGLTSGGTVIAAELRPPRAELGSREGMDAWIDMYHAVRSLARLDARVFLTDSAVGTQEENNLRHLITNLGRDVARGHVIPFLTSKHSMEFCLSYAEQAWEHGFSSRVVLGGGRTVGRPRCVEHAWELRARIRAREPRLTLGGW